MTAERVGVCSLGGGEGWCSWRRYHMTTRGEGCRHGLQFFEPLGRGKGRGRKFPGGIGFRDGLVKVCFMGRVRAPGRVEGVEY